MELLSRADSFVHNVLLDNERLRKDVAQAQADIAALKEQLTKSELDRKIEIYRMVSAAGGTVDTTSYKHGEFDDRRLFVEEHNYGRGRIYRLADPTEMPFFDKVIEAPQMIQEN